jgi:UDP-2,3-diacylglucosamine hydrolase
MARLPTAELQRLPHLAGIPDTGHQAPDTGRAASDIAPVLYVVGDIHLHGDVDDGAGPFPAFLDLLAARPPARLVILGDLFDYWIESAAVALRHEPVLRRLRRLRDAGWRLDLVCGNRELAAGRRLEASSGCRLHWPALDVRLGAQRLRVVHGDRLCHDPGYRVYAAWLRSFWWRAWSACVPIAVHEAVARWLRRGSQRRQQRRHQSRQAEPRRRAAVFIDRRRVQGAARGVDTLLAGHIHESWRRTLGGVDLILVGDWPGRRGHWVEGFADGRLERRQGDFSAG